ncbi:MAG: efflux transporter outer membrane subunit [Desulfobacterales bacterium]|nr:efflux transporter outer membrane subunit [Desulfobacterales bacterium]
MKRARSMRAGVWALLFFIGAGCSLHERQALKKISGETKDLQLFERPLEKRSLESGWWVNFNDEVLTRLIETALLANPDVRSARSGIRRAEAFLSVQKAADLPGVNATGSLGRSRSSGPMGGVLSTWSLSVAASYELDLWGKRSALKAQRVLDHEMAQARLEATKISLSARVADTWYLFQERTRQLALSQKLVDLRKEQLELMEMRYGQGILSVDSIYKGRAELAAAKAHSAALAADVRVASHALSALLNQRPGSPLGHQPEALPTLSPLEKSPLNSRLILTRPDVVLAMKSVEQADEAVAISFAERFPSFSLTSGVGRAGYDAGATDASGSIWSIGGNLLAPLLDWGARKSRVEADKAAMDQAVFSLRSTLLRAFKETEDALVRCRKGEVRLVQFQEMHTSSLAQLAHVKSSYLDGVSDYLSFLETRISEVQAQARVEGGRRAVLSHRISLARSLAHGTP